MPIDLLSIKMFLTRDLIQKHLLNNALQSILNVFSIWEPDQAVFFYRF